MYWLIYSLSCKRAAHLDIVVDYLVNVEAKVCYLLSTRFTRYNLFFLKKKLKFLTLLRMPSRVAVVVAAAFSRRCSSQRVLRSKNDVDICRVSLTRCIDRWMVIIIIIIIIIVVVVVCCAQLAAGEEPSGAIVAAQAGEAGDTCHYKFNVTLVMHSSSSIFFSLDFF